MGSLLTTLLSSGNTLGVYDREFSVIQNNIANANTPGYVKQEQLLLAQPFDPGAGLPGGVLAGPLLSARSSYLEQAVRNQQEQLGSANQRAADLGQIEPLFDLTSASGVPAALNQLFASFSQLAVNPNDAVARQSVIERAGQVAQSFNQGALGIGRVASNVDSQTRAAVGTINQIAADILSINQRFRASAQSTHDAGLDAQLNADLENLSQIANFTVLRASDGTASVYLGGQTPVVIGDKQYNIQADFSGPQTVIRSATGADVTSQITGGNLGALIGEKNTTLPSYAADLNTLAKSVADTVNTTLAQGVDKNGATPTTNLFSYNSAGDAASTLAVTAITPDQIAAALPAAPGGNANAIALAQLANAPVVNGFSFTQFYGDLGARVGRDVSTARQDQTRSQDAVTQAQQQRSDQTGVSLNEEAAKLIQFQQAYQAVGKVITTLDTLTQTLMDVLP